MTSYHIDGYDLNPGLKAGVVMAGRSRSARRLGAPRTSDWRRRAPIPTPRPPIEALSIEETIARFVEANPAQLYRGGA